MGRLRAAQQQPIDPVTAEYTQCHLDSLIIVKPDPNAPWPDGEDQRKTYSRSPCVTSVSRLNVLSFRKNAFPLPDVAAQVSLLI